MSLALLLLHSAQAWGWPPEVGARIQLADGHHYEVVRRLGRGGFKTAFLIRDLSCPSGCELVLGVYHAGSDFVPEARRDIQRLLMEWDHPHARRETGVARAWENGVGHTVALSEYMHAEALSYLDPDPGPDTEFDDQFVSRLREDLGRRRPPEERIFEDPISLRIIAEQLYEAVQSYARHGLVHMDIKPGNVLFEGHPRPTIRRIERGLVYATMADYDFMEKEGTPFPGILRGTLSYVPPERLNGQGNFDPRTSLWSLSMTLFELFHGEHLLYDEQFLRRANLPRLGNRSLILKPEHVDSARRYVERTMEFRIQALQRDGWIEQANAVRTLREAILNGLQFDPAKKAPEFPTHRRKHRSNLGSQNQRLPRPEPPYGAMASHPGLSGLGAGSAKTCKVWSWSGPRCRLDFRGDTLHPDS